MTAKSSKPASKAAAPSRSYDYVIIGNSAAGIAAAESIRAIDKSGSLAIIDREDTPAYSTPLISYLMKGAVTREGMALRDEAFYMRNNLECIFGSPAVSLDARKKQVMLEDGTCIGYGKVLLACGSSPADPPLPGLYDLAGVHTFLNLADAEALMADADTQIAGADANCGALMAAKGASHFPATDDGCVRAVIIGGGLIALKAAEGLAHRVDEVVILARSSLMRTLLDEHAEQMLIDELSKNGIVVHRNTQASAATSQGGRITGVDLAGGGHIGCQLLICAIGEKPNDTLATNAGAKEERGLVCDERMRTSLPDVYAAGDCTQTHNVLDGSDRIIALWPNAVAQGRVAGTCMAGGNASFDGSFAMNAVGFFGLSIISAGLVRPADDSYEVRVEEDQPQESYARFVSKDNRLMGYLLVNRPDNAGIYTSLIKDGTPLSQIRPVAFSRSMEMSDLPMKPRWEGMHQGFPGKSEVIA